MSWLKSLLRLCIFCPPDLDIDDDESPRQIGIFARTSLDEWEEHLFRLNQQSRGITYNPATSKYRDLTEQKRIYHLLPPTITWPNREPFQRLMQRDNLIENGIQVILYAHHELFDNKKNSHELQMILAAVLRYEKQAAEDCCLYTWQHVIQYLNRYSTNQKIIDVEKISAFYELNENQNRAEEKIKPLRRLFTSDEDLSTHHEKLSQIAFISQDIVCIKDELRKLLKNLKQAESANTCVFTIAAIAYRGLFRIMPYQSHNGKTARALINDLLTNYGYNTIYIASASSEKTNASMQTQANPTNETIASCNLHDRYRYELACRAQTPQALAEHLKGLYIMQHPCGKKTLSITEQNPHCAATAIRSALHSMNNLELENLLKALRPFTKQCLSIRDTYGRTPLHDACMQANGQVFPKRVNILLNEGANSSIFDHENKKPFDHLKNSKHRELFYHRWPTGNGDPTEHTDQNGPVSPLHHK
ncbi:MAG: hypothetical protein CMF52_00615 [Legionellales bacterium]|nr:hypothetical protein [Legionellales bacterium]HAV93899.1 hypothetical protein [Pseudomonadota bacterium]